MKLDLHEIINIPGGKVPFEYELNLSDLEFEGVKEIKTPLKVKGQVVNTAGVLELQAVSVCMMTCICARCASEFEKKVELKTRATLADEIFDEENSDIYLLEGDSADVDDIIRTDFILKMDTRFLCSPECKGICPGCGVNLNEDSCRCRPEIDPRLAVLAQFFEDKEE